MNFDDLLKDAWQGQARSAPLPDLTRRVHRRRWRMRLLRGIEIGLTVLAVLIFGRALADGAPGPEHWLLLPFYAVFLPAVWLITLRAPRCRGGDASERIDIYARLRLAQLRTGLRDLWLARIAAWCLLGYAALVVLGTWWLSDASWRSVALLLAGYAVAWLGATFWVSHRLRRRWLREYRVVRQLVA